MAEAEATAWRWVQKTAGAGYDDNLQPILLVDTRGKGWRRSHPVHVWPVGVLGKACCQHVSISINTTCSSFWCECKTLALGEDLTQVTGVSMCEWATWLNTMLSIVSSVHLNSKGYWGSGGWGSVWYSICLWEERWVTHTHTTTLFILSMFSLVWLVGWSLPPVFLRVKLSFTYVKLHLNVSWQKSAFSGKINMQRNIHVNYKSSPSSPPHTSFITYEHIDRQHPSPPPPWQFWGRCQSPPADFPP